MTAILLPGDCRDTLAFCVGDDEIDSIVTDPPYELAFMGKRWDAKKPLNWSSGTQSPGTFQAEGTDRSAHNSHPTVKPTDLMRWLVRLVTPPGDLALPRARIAAVEAP